MSIPTIKSIMLPFLQYLDDSQEHHRLTIADALAAKPFELTPEQKAELMPKGVPVFGYRCDWAKTHLVEAGLVEIPKRGYSRITDNGLAFLEAFEDNPAEIKDAIMKSPAKFYDYVKNRWPIEGESDNDHPLEESIEDADDDQTLAGSVENKDNDQIPEESIEENYQQIRKELAAELLQKIKDNSPAFFEQLVIDLLVKMGYGGSREDAGKAVGGSGDGGIDGIIKADPLGLNVVYVQAKRWKDNVGEPPIRDFVGALDGKGVQEGIFITTSDFNPAAEDFTERSSKRVILINGNQLADYMIENNVGVSTTKTYEIKRVDSDYFVDPAKLPTQGGYTEPERKPPQKTHANRKVETRLHVTMSDQTEISHDKTLDTFCEVLKRFGFENVHEIEPGVVSKVPFPHGKHKRVDGYWINANNGTTPKKKILDRIAGKFGFSGAWNVKVIDK